MTTSQVEKLASQRLTMFFVKLYFPRMLNEKTGTKLPEENERFKAYLDLCQYLEKRPLNARLAVLLSAIDKRETECLCLGAKPLPLAAEWKRLLKLCDAACERGEPKIIAFPLGSD